MLNTQQKSMVSCEVEDGGQERESHNGRRRSFAISTAPHETNASLILKSVCARERDPPERTRKDDADIVV